MDRTLIEIRDAQAARPHKKYSFDNYHDCKAKSFKDGFDFAVKVMAARSEFNEEEAHNHVAKMWPVDKDDESYEYDQKMNWRTGFVNGSRWQATKSRARLEVAQEEMASLRHVINEKQREIDRLRKILTKIGKAGNHDSI